MIESIKIINNDTKANVTINMSDSVYVLKYAYFGPIKATHQSYKYPNQMGETVVDSYIGKREVEIYGWITGPTEDAIKRRKESLSAMLNPLQSMIAQVGEYVLNFKLDESIGFSKSYEEDNDILCKFVINGTAYDPLWKSAYEDNVVAAGIIPKFRFPLIISTGNADPEKDLPLIFGVREPKLIVAVANTGAVEVGMRIVFKARGTVTNPKLTNITTQKYFKINKVMNAGEIIEVNTSVGSKTVLGTSVDGVQSNYYGYRDLSSSWLQLSRGDNLLKYSADENGDLLDVTVYYELKFLDVAGVEL